MSTSSRGTSAAHCNRPRSPGVRARASRCAATNRSAATQYACPEDGCAIQSAAPSTRRRRSEWSAWASRLSTRPSEHRLPGGGQVVDQPPGEERLDLVGRARVAPSPGRRVPVVGIARRGGPPEVPEVREPHSGTIRARQCRARGAPGWVDTCAAMSSSFVAIGRRQPLQPLLVVSFNTLAQTATPARPRTARTSSKRAATIWAGSRATQVGAPLANRSRSYRLWGGELVEERSGQPEQRPFGCEALACVPGSVTQPHAEIGCHLARVEAAVLGDVVGVQPQERVPVVALGEQSLDLVGAGGRGLQ